MSEGKYETELREAASLLQGVLPIGEVKHIGLLEVAAGIEQLIEINASLRAACGMAMRFSSPFPDGFLEGNSYLSKIVCDALDRANGTEAP